MRVCIKCKQIIKDGKLYCGNCGGLGVEIEEEKPVSSASEVTMEEDVAVCCEEKMAEQVISSDEKQKLVDIDEWKNASSLNKALSHPKIPRVFTILNVIGMIVLIGVCVALLLSAINILKSDVLSESIMLELAKAKFEKLLNVLFIGAMILYLLFRLPYVKLYLLNSKRNFIKKRLEYVKAEGLETESHEECLERLSDSDEDFGSAYAYLLARDQAKFTKEILCSTVTICGKLLEIIFGFIFCNALIEELLVPNPSLDITFFLTQPALWGVVVCMVIDIFVPSFRDTTLVFEELEKAEIKNKIGKK